MNPFEIIRARVDLAEIAEKYTELHQSGKACVGRCPRPDHEDRDPSFYVYPDRRFHCYGCGWHGDVTDLWTVVHGVESGIKAALNLARECGIELPGIDPEARKLAEERQQRESEYLENAKKAHDALREAPDVIEWWKRRGFDEELRQRFLLGEHEGSAIIPFWNRGRVQGFIKRNLEGTPKYELQKAEKFVSGYRPLFIPGTAYGEAFLVEGYMDALALVALGFSAIAVGGTGISERQLDELRRLLGPFYILPDADESGRKAAQEWAERLYPKALLCPADYERQEENNDD
jgi:DNA primase